MSKSIVVTINAVELDTVDGLPGFRVYVETAEGLILRDRLSVVKPGYTRLKSLAEALNIALPPSTSRVDRAEFCYRAMQSAANLSIRVELDGKFIDSYSSDEAPSKPDSSILPKPTPMKLVNRQAVIERARRKAKSVEGVFRKVSDTELVYADESGLFRYQSVEAMATDLKLLAPDELIVEHQ